MSAPEPKEKHLWDLERKEVLQQYEEWTEIPGLLLAVAWLVLLVIDLVTGLNAVLGLIVNAIWLLFIVDFFIRFFLAPEKVAFLKRSWVTAISLLIPAMRIFRIFRVIRVLRAAQAVRGINLVRIIGSLNRGMRSLQRSFGRKKFPYLLGLTMIVIVVGAGGMFFFENPNSVAESNPQMGQGAGLTSYAEALWWTTMIMTTLGSEYWPFTAEGRMLALLLSIYALGVFGYITAALASYFIGQDTESAGSVSPAVAEVRRLREELAALRQEIRGLQKQLPGSGDEQV